jgi:GNAT superfamily N-acetyltransferase
MTEAERIQIWLRENARQHDQLAVVRVSPFTIFIHPDAAAPYENYAIPDIPVAGDLHTSLAKLRATFQRYDRRPRITFIEPCAPELGAALHRHRFSEVGRQQVMLCTPGTFQPPPVAPGIAITTLTGDAPLTEWQAAMTVGRRVFGSAAEPAVTAVEAEQHRQSWGRCQTLLAALDGQIVGVGALMAPTDGLTELAGIGTLATFRRRGIATLLTAHAVQLAFARGISRVFLTAGPQAARIYARVGFQSIGATLAYEEPPVNVRNLEYVPSAPDS